MENRESYVEEDQLPKKKSKRRDWIRSFRGRKKSKPEDGDSPRMSQKEPKKDHDKKKKSRLKFHFPKLSRQKKYSQAESLTEDLPSAPGTSTSSSINVFENPALDAKTIRKQSDVKIFIEDFETGKMSHSLERLNTLRRKRRSLPKQLTEPVYKSRSMAELAYFDENKENTIAKSDSDLSQTSKESRPNTSHSLDDKQHHEKHHFAGRILKHLGLHSHAAHSMCFSTSNLDKISTHSSEDYFESSDAIIKKRRKKRRCLSAANLSSAQQHVFNRNLALKRNRPKEIENSRQTDVTDLSDQVDEIRSDVMNSAQTLLGREEVLQDLLNASRELEAASEQFEKRAKETKFKYFCRKCCCCCCC